MTNVSNMADDEEGHITEAAAVIASDVGATGELKLAKDVSAESDRDQPSPGERQRGPRFPDFEPENETFPWQVLPETIRGAVIEICVNDKVAVPIAVQSVLSAVSLACQDLIWIDRGIGQKSVCSLYMLAVTDTGARKSRADGAVTATIDAYDREKRAEYAARLKADEYLSKERRRNIVELEKDSRAWRRQIRTLTIRGVSGDDGKREDVLKAAKAELEEVERRLAELSRDESEYQAPRLQRVFYSTISIRKLEQNLAENWPSAGLFSDEAAGILNARGESDMSSLDKLWEGKAIDVVGSTDRESFFVEDPRLTVSLMVQPVVFDHFLERRGEMAKGIGFMSRVLLSRPDTPYGKRMVNTAEPRSTVWLDLFNNRVRSLLSLAHSDIAGREQARTTLCFSPTAQQAWEKDFNEMEGATADGGALVFEREFVNRYSEHVARLAALFHFFEGGAAGGHESGDDRLESEIPEAIVTSAIRVVEWYLKEYGRVFNPEVTMREMALYVLKQLKRMLDEKNGGELLEPLGGALNHPNCRVPYHALRANCSRFGLKKTEKFDQVVQWLVAKGNIAMREREVRQAGAVRNVPNLEPKSIEIQYKATGSWKNDRREYQFFFDLRI